MTWLVLLKYPSSLPIYLFIYLLFNYLIIYLYIYFFIYLFIHLFIYLFNQPTNLFNEVNRCTIKYKIKKIKI